MAVPEQTPFIEYTANGTTTNFALTFDCDNSDYLIVTLNGVDASVGSWSLVGTSIVFTTAPLNGVVVAIKRDTPLERTTNYQLYDNSFQPIAVNKDFDQIWKVLQELNFGNSFTSEKLQELIDQIVGGEVAGLPAEILARIAGDEANLNLINAEALRAYAAEQSLLVEILNTENSLSTAINNETVRAIAAENAIGVGNKAYLTYAAMDADKASIPAKSKVTVTNDATSSNNGDWQWDGVTFTKSAYDPITQSNAYADSKVDALMTAAPIPLAKLSSIGSGFILNTGVEQSSTNWSKSGFIKVNIKDKVTYNATGNSTIAFIAAYDTNKTFLRDLRPISGSTLTNVSGELSIPSDVKYIRVSFYSANSTAYSFSLTPYKIGVSGIDMPSVSSLVFADIQGSVNLFDSTKATDNTFLSNNVIGASTSWFVSDYIGVVAGESYVTNGASTGSATSGIHYYDASKNFLSYGSRQIANTAFVIPVGVSFIRINYTKSASSSIKDTIVAAGAAIAPDLLKQKIKEEISEITIPNRYAGKVLMTLGDSITDSTATPFTYPPIVAEHFGMSLFDGGWSGRRIRNAFGRTTIASDTNILLSNFITIAHGTNDFKLETSLGTISDAPTPKSTLDDPVYNSTTNQTDGTFYADYKGVIEHILTVNPQTRIMLITPIRRTQPAATGTDTNAKGFKLVDYVNAVKAVADLYGLPVLDNFNTSGFNTKTMPNWTSDGLHPTAWAQENVMAQKVIGFIESN